MSSIWSRYVERVIAGESQELVAARIGITQGTVSRWLSGRKVPDKHGTIAAFAQAYGRNPIEAFVAAGALTLEDAEGAVNQESRSLLVDLGLPDDIPPTDDPARDAG